MKKNSEVRIQQSESRPSLGEQGVAWFWAGVRGLALRATIPFFGQNTFPVF